ncbi:MAG TPA: Ig-like domain-containing protein [Bacteroidota bacterium]|nr:Ig-like domain-containing protein [Bacteroidota bacterium]
MSFFLDSSRHVVKTAATVASALLLAGCAGQRLPEGGPIDTVPPEILEVYPSPNSTNFEGQQLSFRFSKYVDRRSVEESIFISPFVPDVEFDWSGKEVELDFPHPLKKNTTYVVTIGTDVVDRRSPPNRMAKAYTLAFSTGSQIDRGEISGRLYDAKPSGVMVFAYRLDGILADTLNPMKQKPDYITQCGNKGEYSLSHLAFGRYRLLAVRDEYRNLLYDPETDAMSTAPEDIALEASDSLRKGVNFQLTSEDTTAPRLLDAVATDARHVELKFSEALDSSSVAAGGFSVSDTGGARQVPVVDFFLHSENRALVTLLIAPASADSELKVAAPSVKDLAGHTINPLAMSKQFEKSALPDTFPPRLLAASVADSLTRISLDGSFRFDFSDALRRETAEHGILLAGQDSVPLPTKFLWSSSASVVVAPVQPLQPNARYTMRILFDSLVDRSGNHLRDSTKRFTLRTIDPDQLSSIEGTVLDADTSRVDRYIVVAENSREQSKKPVQLVTHRGAKFLFSQLKEGEYRLQAFQDLNLNGVYSSGRPYPYVPAERFSVFPDSIKVRARWPVDRVVIRME